MALEFSRKNRAAVVVMLDAKSVKGQRKDVIAAVEARCSELFVPTASLSAVILDSWENEKGHRRLLEEVQKAYPNVPVILLQGFEDCTDIAGSIESEHLAGFEVLYLWSLSRVRMRELVEEYLKDQSTLDDDAVTDRLIEDIDALNMHRTPMNCLLILKSLEQEFEDSPVNRTEMIGRVLHRLFYEFDQIPRYSTRPDLKDCEYALGYLSEWLIRAHRSTFSKEEFSDKVREYCRAKILDLDRDVLFSFLVSERILVRKGTQFGFRFSYWLFYFAAHRMRHDHIFAEFIFAERRYASTPEIIEFYTGIDRQRTDAVCKLTDDLQRINFDFAMRTKIPEAFNPFQSALWIPSTDALEKMEQEVVEGAAGSSLPRAVKDAIADKGYDPARPYRQELSEFITQSTLNQAVQAMRGAARALRNSDHVDPDAKTKLLREVFRCWTQVAQVLVVISPLLAEQKKAVFEDIGFCLDETFDHAQTPKERWNLIMSAIPDNIVNWHQEDLFSKKLGALLGAYLTENHGNLGELLVLLLLVRQRPSGWEREIESFILRSPRNAYYLGSVWSELRNQLRIGPSNERTRQQLRRLSAMAVSRYRGAKHPSTKDIEKVAKEFDAKDKVPAKLPAQAHDNRLLTEQGTVQERPSDSGSDT